MRLEAEAGTDGARVCLYDPAALPDGFDGQLNEDIMGALESAQDEGRLVFTETGSDGAFLLHVYVDVSMPEELARYAVDPLELTLAVPSGQLVFCGAEYAHKRASRAATDNPHMLQRSRMALPAGRYRVRLFRTEFPDDNDVVRFAATVSRTANRWFGLVNMLTAASSAGVFAALIVLVTPLRDGLWWYVPALALLALATFLLRRGRAFRGAQTEWDRIQREFPSMVAEFTTKSAATGEPRATAESEREPRDP